MTHPGRNDPCPCGSGRKHKKCCGVQREPEVPTTTPTRKVAAPARPPAAAPKPARPGKRKLVLLYPPYSTATAPPLGVFVLKAHVEQALPSWSVRVMDLNLAAHHDFFERLRSGDPSPDLGNAHEPLDAAALLRAAETFRGDHPQEFYGDPERMLAHSFLWERVVPLATATPKSLRNALYHGQPMPAWVHRYADQVLAEKPTIVGIFIGYLQQRLAALALAQVLKQSGVPIVFGGTEFNGGLGDVTRAESWPVDYIVTGSGEQPLVAILSGEADRHPVPGVIRREHGKFVACPPTFDSDLDAIDGPDFSDTDLHDYYSPEPVAPVQTSRGCYWRRCAFCTHYRAAGDSYQLRSLSKVVAELRRHVHSGIRHFALMDDIISPARLSQLSQAIVEAGLDLHYYGMAKPVRQFDAHRLGQMARSGCRFVLWGLESGCQRVLDLMDKGTRLEEIEAVFDKAAEAGLKNHVFVLCGFPTETREEFQATVRLLERHRASITRVHKSKFVLERNTPIHDHPERFSITRQWAHENTSLLGFECNAGMTDDEARDALDEAMPALRSFDSPRPDLPDFRQRDHLLLQYAREG